MAHCAITLVLYRRSMNDGLMLSMASLGDLCLHSNTDMKPYDCSTRFHFVFSNASEPDIQFEGIGKSVESVYNICMGYN